MSKLLTIAGIFSAILLVGCTPAAEEAVEETEEATEAVGEAVEESAEAATEEVGEAMEETGEAMTAEAADYEMTMENFEYSMDEITAAPGETLTISVENVGGFHDMDIEELDIDTEPVEEGETITITVEIPEDAESGTQYAYYCSVGQHRANGMEGFITVE